MENVVPILGAVSLLCVVPVLFRVRRFVRGTTLVTAWRWAAAAWMLWVVGWIAAGFHLPPSLQNQIWYAAGVLGLCPPISVLGAKRPGSRVWAAFVVLPLVLVFSWPAAAAWVRQFPPEPLHLETPMLLGYSLVLVMGYGNYLGTRHTLISLMTAAGLGWLVFQLFQTAQPKESLIPIGPTALVVTAAVFPLFVKTPTEPAGGFDRLWRDFQEAFGIVWAKRVMDRVNHIARQEQWSARLEMDGVTWNADVTESDRQHTQDLMDHTFRWLFRRFVDPAWIEERLEPHQPQTPARELPSE